MTILERLVLAFRAVLSGGQGLDAAGGLLYYAVVAFLFWAVIRFGGSILKSVYGLLWNAVRRAAVSETATLAQRPPSPTEPTTDVAEAVSPRPRRRRRKKEK